MRTSGGMGGQRMNWFQQIRQVLQAYYVAGQPEDVVGFLRGNGSPMQWRGMATADPPHNQMLILGNQEPTREEWDAAGVGQRGVQFTVTTGMLTGFIVLYAGFMYRPWGRIHLIDGDALAIGFPGSLRSWQANATPPRPRR
jgi:hypothetical protein